MHGEAWDDAKEMSALSEELFRVQDERRPNEAREHGELRIHSSKYVGK